MKSETTSREFQHKVGRHLADRAKAVIGRVWRFCLLRELPNSRICFLDHFLAEINAYQIVLEDVVVEHVLGGFTQIGDPFGNRRGLDPIGHILRVNRTGRMIVAADTTDAAGYEMCVTWILAFHEDAVTTEDRGRCMTLGDNAIAE